MKPGFRGRIQQVFPGAFSFFLLCLLIATASQSAMAFKKVVGLRGEMLVGEITTKELYKESPEFKENAQDFVPDPKAVEAVKGMKEPVSIIMFLGTWCGDSQRESPKLMKLLDEAKNPRISLTMYGVDTNKEDGGGLARKYNIQRVPTIIFMRGNTELGRIIENPKESMEADFLAIVGVK